MTKIILPLSNNYEKMQKQLPKSQQLTKSLKESKQLPKGKNRDRKMQYYHLMTTTGTSSMDNYIYEFKL